MKFPILSSGILIFFVCLCLHVIIWRVRYPKKRPIALLLIFILLPIIFIGGYIGLGRLELLSVNSSIAVMDLPAIYLLHFALSLAYILSYPAVEAASPSLSISLIIGDSGRQGVLYEDLLHHFNSKILLQPRIKDLMDAKLITESNGCISITARGIIFIRPFIFIRRLLGLPIGKG